MELSFVGLWGMRMLNIDPKHEDLAVVESNCLNIVIL